MADWRGIFITVTAWRELLLDMYGMSKADRISEALVWTGVLYDPVGPTASPGRTWRNRSYNAEGFSAVLFRRLTLDLDWVHAGLDGGSRGESGGFGERMCSMCLTETSDKVHLDCRSHRKLHLNVIISPTGPGSSRGQGSPRPLALTRNLTLC